VTSMENRAVDASGVTRRTNFHGLLKCNTECLESRKIAI
jgi:hypothetical protein